MKKQLAELVLFLVIAFLVLTLAAQFLHIIN